jgi:hypothetical protein
MTFIHRDNTIDHKITVTDRSLRVVRSKIADSTTFDVIVPFELDELVASYNKAQQTRAMDKLANGPCIIGWAV